MTDGPVIAESTEVERSTTATILVLPRLLGGVLADIRAIAEGMAVLPKLLETLTAIEARVETLDAEVRLMRASVNSIEGEVTELKDGIAHPLRRIGERARALGRPPR